MLTVRLSDAALVLLRRRLSGEWVEVTDVTQPLYSELVDAGLMIPLHSFARGRDGAYRLTEAAVGFRDGINAPSTLSPSV